MPTEYLNNFMKMVIDCNELYTVNTDYNYSGIINKFRIAKYFNEDNIKFENWSMYW